MSRTLGTPQASHMHARNSIRRIPASPRLLSSRKTLTRMARLSPSSAR